MPTAIRLSTALRAAPCALLLSLGALRAETADAARIEALKRAYLACEVAARQGRMDDLSAMLCSELYEALKAQAFGGSAARLRDWYRAVTRAPGLG